MRTLDTGCWALFLRTASQRPSWTRAPTPYSRSTDWMGRSNRSKLGWITYTRISHRFGLMRTCQE
jgi:hypothetical protein